MTKVFIHILFIIAFIALTIGSYAILFLVDYSFDFFALARIAVMGVAIFYFYLLTKNLDFLKSAKDKLNKFPSAKENGETLVALFLFTIHLLFVNVGGEYLNNKLLASDSRETTATIKDCHKSKGTEYCVYEYFVGNKRYEIKYCNEPDHLKFKESDTTSIIYYAKFPAISRLKKDWQ